MFICCLMLFGCGGSGNGETKGVVTTAQTGDKIETNLSISDYEIVVEDDFPVIKKGEENVGYIIFSEKDMYDINKSVKESMDSFEILEQDQKDGVDYHIYKFTSSEGIDYGYETIVKDSKTSLELVLFLEEAEALNIIKNIDFKLVEE